MSSFDLTAAIAAWRRHLLSRGKLEPSYVDELESGLHDRYEANLLRGMSPEEAFAAAREKVSPSAELAAEAYQKHTGNGFLYLLPGYLKVALRHMRRRQGYNLTNYVCLAIGILTAALALLYLNYETSYDAFVPNVQQKYRVGMQLRSQGYSMISFPDFYGTTPEDQLRQINGLADIRGIEATTQFFTFDEPQLVTANQRELATGGLLETNTPSNFFNFFGWSFVSGSVEAFAATPNTAAISVSQAERYFGNEWRTSEVIGAPLRIDTIDYVITGVFPDVPPNSHFDFTIALNRDKIDYWGARTYVQLADGEVAGEIKQRINDNFASINVRLTEDELFGGVILQPLRSVHLHSDLLYELKPPGKPIYLYIIGIISLIVLLLTVSNYTNLSVAMNAGRAREIGMRKVFGATEGQVAGQFLVEALVLSALTLPLVLVGLWFIAPRFDDLMGTAIAENLLTNPVLWAAVLGVTLFVGVLAGAYPAFFLARRRVLTLFRGQLSRGSHRKFGTRKLIITLQFALLIGLCSLTLFVNRQLSYIQDKDLGYVTEGVLYVNLTGDSSRFATFRNEVERLPEVMGVGSGTILGHDPFNQTTYKLSGTSEVFDDAHNVAFDYRSLDLLDIETSVPDYVANPDEAPERMVLINTTLAERLKNRFGITDAELVGQTIIQEPEYVDPETGEVGFPYVVGGTFKDINVFSLRDRVEPMFMSLYREPRFVYWAVIRYQNASPSAILQRVKTAYDKLELDRVFEHAFLDDNLADLYAEERRIATLSTYFSLAAFLTAIIGLIALTAFLTTLRQGEIGVRKILGASQLDILSGFNREYLLPLGLALLIAVPLTWLGVSNWLDTFAYRIDINPLIFLLAALITLLVTSLAVSVIVLRAANAIPARVLTRNQ